MTYHEASIYFKQVSDENKLLKTQLEELNKKLEELKK